MSAGEFGIDWMMVSFLEFDFYKGLNNDDSCAITDSLYLHARENLQILRKSFCLFFSS